MERLLGDLPPRTVLFLAAFAAVMLVLPFLVGDYLLTVLIAILYFAYVGQAWNVMMGFAGQLSLGHALYVGLAAYLSAALFKDFGVSPWIGLMAAMLTAALAGAVIGFLALRFSVTGVYFAILTIAFAEFTRIGFDHLDIVNGTGGLFLPVSDYNTVDLWNLRGPPTMFYYVILAAAVIALGLCRFLMRSRIGYFWLAVREDEQAARAAGVDTFRYKISAVVVSAVMTSFGGVFYAFYYNNLFPEQVFSVSRSIELIIAPIIGGLGTLLGPIVGAFLLTGLAETLGALLEAAGVNLPGVKQLLYGVCLLLVVVALPGGVWPWLARRLHIRQRRPMTTLLAMRGVTKRFRGLTAVNSVSLTVRKGQICAIIGPNGAGKTTLFNMIAGVLKPDAGTIAFVGRRIDGLGPDATSRRGIGRTFQLVRPFPRLTVEENVMIGALVRRPSVSQARSHARDLLQRLDLYDKRDAPASSLNLPSRKRLEVARALATEPQLLLLDEVMAGLRPTETDRMVALLNELNASAGLTIVLIEHVMRAVMALAHHMVVLHHGAAIAEGRPEDVVSTPAVIESYLGVEQLG